MAPIRGTLRSVQRLKPSRGSRTGASPTSLHFHGLDLAVGIEGLEGMVLGKEVPEAVSWMIADSLHPSWVPLVDMAQHPALDYSHLGSVHSTVVMN